MGNPSALGDPLHACACSRGTAAFARELEDARAVLRAIAQGDPAGQLRTAAAHAAERLSRALRTISTPPVVFAPATQPDTWHVGPLGDVRLVPGNGLGLVAAWLALSGARPECVDLAGPGARHPDTVVSRAVRQTAVRWAEQIGRHDLAAAFRRVHVKHGQLHYSPAADAPQVRTQHVIPVSAQLHAPAVPIHDAPSSDEVNPP